MYLLTLGYMFRFTRNHHQALSKNTKIHYIKLLKRVLGSQTFTINFWLWYMWYTTHAGSSRYLQTRTQCQKYTSSKNHRGSSNINQSESIAKNRRPSIAVRKYRKNFRKQGSHIVPNKYQQLTVTFL